MKELNLIPIVVFFSFALPACNNNENLVQKQPHQDIVPAIYSDTSAEVIELPPVFNTAYENIKKDSAEINLVKGVSFKLVIPAGYKINVAAEGLNRLRFMAISPDGRLFCTDMFDKNDNRKGKVLIFENWNDSIKRFQKTSTYASDLHNPNQIAFYKNYIYIAETEKLTRYKYSPGDAHPQGAGEVVATFPAYGLSYKYGGWHLTRSINFHRDKLYVSVGSSCNACIEKEDVRASVQEMNPDGSDVKIYARGLRNSVGLKWIADELWATTMGRDLIGPDKPEDQFLKLERNGYYGWPFYYQYRNKIYEDLQFRDYVKAAWVPKPIAGFAGFKAHSAPLGFEYLKNFEDPYLRNSVLVCLHGSTTVSRQRGNAIVRVEGGNNYSEVISGFLGGKTEETRFGRPCDILMKDRRSFYFTDDANGVLYYVWKY